MKTWGLSLLLLFAIFEAKTSLASARAVDDSSEEDAYRAACISELGLDENKIIDLNNQDVVPEDDDDFNNFLSCTWKKSGLQKPDGQIDFEALKEVFAKGVASEFEDEPEFVQTTSRQILSDAANACRQEYTVGKTHGEAVSKAQNCIMKKIKTSFEDLSRKMAQD